MFLFPLPSLKPLTTQSDAHKRQSSHANVVSPFATDEEWAKRDRVGAAENDGVDATTSGGDGGVVAKASHGRDRAVRFKPGPSQDDALWHDACEIDTSVGSFDRIIDTVPVPPGAVVDLPPYVVHTPCFLLWH